MRRIVFFSIALLLSSCIQNPEQNKPKCKIVSSYIPQFAKGFKIDYYKGFKVLSVLQNDSATCQYVQFPLNKKRPIGFENAIALSDSIYSIINLSTSQTAAFDALNNLDIVKGVANKNLIYSTLLKEEVYNGTIADIGFDYQPDLEKILRLKPQLMFSDGEYATQNANFDKLKAAGIDIVYSQDYREKYPLARAEWLVFYSFFINQEQQAIQFLDSVFTRYQEVKSEISKKSTKHTVFCNYPYNEIWYMPAKSNYVTNLLADAGLHFFWADVSPNNGLNLSLSFEEVLRKAIDADHWLLFSSEKSKSELLLKDSRLSNFNAYKTGNVYSSSLRSTNQGANDYWESGVYRPDLVLQDFHKLFYLNDTTNLVYFNKLK